MTLYPFLPAHRQPNHFQGRHQYLRVLPPLIHLLGIRINVVNHYHTNHVYFLTHCVSIPLCQQIYANHFAQLSKHAITR